MSKIFYLNNSYILNARKGYITFAIFIGICSMIGGGCASRNREIPCPKTKVAPIGAGKKGGLVIENNKRDRSGLVKKKNK